MKVDCSRFRNMFERMGAFGGTPDGGMHRLTLSAEDGAARDQLTRMMTEAGLRVVVDPIGNIFGLLDWAGADAPVVMTGSHLDSQPYGGRFDGAYGVIAALAAVQDVRQALLATGSTPRCNLAVVNWTNEEGARFQPSLLGSAVYAKQIDLQYALDRRDGNGIRVGDALQQIGYAGTGTLQRPLAYVELHVECGSELDGRGERFGIVTRHWGNIKYRLAFLGEAAHTGPTPMEKRRDALLAAAHLICSLRRMTDDAPGTLYSSVGRLEVQPNSPNVVPGEAVMFIELRSPEPAVLSWADAALNRHVAEAEAVAYVRHEVRARDTRPAGSFDNALVALAEQEAAQVGQTARHLDTIAGHDAVSMNTVCPSVLLVVPSINGICHNPAEFTRPEDLDLGVEMLARMLLRLCRDGLSAQSDHRFAP